MQYSNRGNHIDEIENWLVQNSIQEMNNANAMNIRERHKKLLAIAVDYDSKVGQII